MDGMPTVLAACVVRLQPCLIPRGQEIQTRVDLFWLGDLGTSKKKKKNNNLNTEPEPCRLASPTAIVKMLCVTRGSVRSKDFCSQNGNINLFLVCNFLGDFWWTLLQ